MGNMFEDAFGVGANVVTLGGYGAYKQTKAQEKAAKRQQQAYENNLAMEKQQYEDQQKAFSPYQAYGYQGLGMLTGQDYEYEDPITGEIRTIKGSGRAYDFRDPSFDQEYTAKLGDYTSSPAYQAQNALAQEELQRQLMMRGLNYGATGASAGAKLNQQLVASDYDKYRSELANRYNALRGEKANEYGRIMDALKVGQGAASSIGNAGQNYVSGAGQANLGAAGAWGEGKMASSGMANNVLGTQLAVVGSLADIYGKFAKPGGGGETNWWGGE
jgi:hypothetical protein